MGLFCEKRVGIERVIFCEVYVALSERDCAGREFIPSPLDWAKVFWPFRPHVELFTGFLSFFMLSI